MRKFGRKLSTTAVLGICLAAIMLLGVVIVALGNITDGFENWDLHAPNEENLYQQLTFAETDGVINGANGKNGITVKLTEDNELKVNGNAESDLELTIGSYTLKSGTSYIFDSSIDNGSAGTIYMALRTKSGTVLAESYNGAQVISGDTLTADTEVYVVLYIANKTSIDNVTLRPILCEGGDVDDIVKFY